jgi:hypothetical protein
MKNKKQKKTLCASFASHKKNNTSRVPLVPVVSTLKRKTNKFSIHESFSTILKDNSRGGLLLSNIIHNILEQNRLGLPLFLTPTGIKASHDLINMLNLLSVDNSSKFKGDNFLFDYLSNASNPVLRYNMECNIKNY